jgi:lysophospholipase L1-like esterase
MKTSFTRTFAAALAVTAFSLLGCSSGNGGSPPGTGSAGNQGGAVTPSGGVSAGGAAGVSTTAISFGGTTSNGSSPASGGKTQTQSSSTAQGGSAAGGTVTSAAGQTATGSSAVGGAATGGTTTGGSVTGGTETGGSVTGGTTALGGTTTSATGGGPHIDPTYPIGGTTSVTGGNATGTRTGGRTSSGGATGPTGGTAAGGKTATGGTASGGTATGGTTAPPIGGSLGSSDGTTPIKVWMAGDSTMSGSGCDGGGWGSQFASVFNSKVTVVNSSVAGRSIQTWLYDPNVTSTMDANGECIVNPKTYNPRWTAMTDPNTGMKPGDYLFIEFGINDATTTCEAGKTRHVGSALFQTYLTTMAQAAKDRGAQPIFLTSMSGLQCSGSTAQPNRAFGPETKAAGAADNVPVIDATVLSAALYTSLGLCPSSGVTSGASGAFFCNDTTHFEKAGALQIAQMVGKALKDQGIGLGAYVAN